MKTEALKRETVQDQALLRPVWLNLACEAACGRREKCSLAWPSVVGDPNCEGVVMTSGDGLSHMDLALAEGRAAAARGEVPVGAVVVGPSGVVLAKAGNQTRERNDPTAHAEMLAIRAACAALGDERLTGCDLYVTLEPCPMCAAAISFARIRRLYYGASDPKSGGVEHGPRLFNQTSCHHAPEVYGGFGETEAAALLRTFFAERRSN